MPHSLTGRAMWSDKPIATVEDLAGVVVRDDYPAAELWEYFDAVIVDAPIWEGGENYSRGIIDASYAGYPGAIPCCGHLLFPYAGDHIMRGQCGAQSCNLDAWNALPDEYKDIFWDILENELPDKMNEFGLAYDGPNHEKFLAEGGKEGQGGTIVHQTQEGWIDPIVEVLKNELWPDIVTRLNAAGVDGQAWLDYCIQLAIKHSPPGYIPAVLLED
jgi:hypothetical protein